MEKSITPKTVLVSIIHGNNEIGTIQDVKSISSICQKHQIALHLDAVQAFGQISVDLSIYPIDMLTLSAHKFYGPKEKMKEFVDLCHQNGIAVILDIALNHAFGRNAMNRMWMNDPDGDGWGSPASDSPYFNMVATHSYSVGSDFNHQQSRTQNYTRRVVKQWIEEFKIDGFRWDLTKGFTQNATGSDANTNAYQQDREIGRASCRERV